MKNLEELVRPNIWKLKPYSSARDEYAGVEATVFLDANESPFNAPYNRYPDPLQLKLKDSLSRIKEVSADSIFLGNGSDEAIDLVFRVFCEPGKDNVVAISPTYGMYEVCADINNVAYRKVPLDARYGFRADELLAATDEHTKVIFLCSPNNPTGNDLSRSEMEALLTAFPGIVVIDEAYSDFSAQRPFRKDLAQYPNLIVLNTFSKAWALAAVRLGMAFASPQIIALFNKVKYPYNVNLLTQEKAFEQLQRRYDIDKWVAMLKEERTQMMRAFGDLPFCRCVYPSDANFFLARVEHADRVYRYLVDHGIIVRNRSKVELCENSLRVTVGTKQENSILLAALRQYKP